MGRGAPLLLLASMKLASDIFSVTTLQNASAVGRGSSIAVAVVRVAAAVVVVVVVVVVVAFGIAVAGRGVKSA